MVNHYELAAMSQAVYQRQPEPASVPQNWERRFNYYPTNDWGFGGSAFIDAVRKEIVLVFRGTDMEIISHWLGNAGIGLGNVPAQTGAATNFFQQVGNEIRTEEEGIVADALRQIIEQLNNPLPQADQEGNDFWARFVRFITHLIGNHRASLAIVLVITSFLPLIVSAPVGLATLLGFFAAEDIEAVPNRAWTELMNRLQMQQNPLAQTRNGMLNGYKLIFTGHSLGGAISEILSGRLGFPAVTFDPPGMGNAYDNDEMRIMNGERQIVGYVTAPNIVNCSGRQIGRKYRLYIPHVEGNWTWSHFANGVFSSSVRVAAYAGGAAAAAGAAVAASAVAAAGGIALISGAGATAAGNALAVAGGAAAAAGTGAVGASAVTAAGTGVDIIISSVFRSWPWFRRQHDMGNIRQCFSVRSGLPTGTLYTVEEWPTLRLLLQSAVRSPWAFLKPFNESQPNISNLWYENDMCEARIRELPNYRVIEIEAENISAEINNTLETIRQALDRPRIAVRLQN